MFDGSSLNLLARADSTDQVAITTTHRRSTRTVKTPIDAVIMASPLRTRQSRPRILAYTAQGMRASQYMASRVPTQFAFSESHTFPRTRWAKLVVMPQVGHGLPVQTTKLHSGRPSCVCVAMSLGEPSSR